MLHRSIARLALIVPFAALLSVGCEDNGATGPRLGALATITVTPNTNSIAIGTTQQFIATGRDADGNVVAIPSPLVWSVQLPAAGAINSGSGMFTADIAAGTYANAVRATSGSIFGQASITITSPGPLVAINVTPNPANLATGGAQTFTATGQDVGGNAVAIPAGLVWSVVNGGGAIVAGTGAFTAGAVAGTFTNTVRATSGSVSGLASVNVTSPSALTAITITPNPKTLAEGSTQQYTASGQDASGASVPIPPGMTWAVVNGGGSITSPAGLFTAGSIAGTFPNTIRAQSGSISGFASVNVTTSVSVGPSFGSAERYAVLGSTAVSCIGVTVIRGNVGTAPAGAVTGFPAPCVIAAPGDPDPHVNDSDAMVAQADVTPAYNALAAMPCGTVLDNQDLGGMTLAPGVYCFSSSAQLTGNLTLAGPSNGLWVFQIGTAITTGTSAEVILNGGALAKNVFWQVGSSATLGQTTKFQGNIVAAVSITMVQGSTLLGRALSKAGITMDGNTITLP